MKETNGSTIYCIIQTSTLVQNQAIHLITGVKKLWMAYWWLFFLYLALHFRYWFHLFFIIEPWRKYKIQVPKIQITQGNLQTWKIILLQW